MILRRESSCADTGCFDDSMVSCSWDSQATYPSGCSMTYDPYSYLLSLTLSSSLPSTRPSHVHYIPPLPIALCMVKAIATTSSRRYSARILIPTWDEKARSLPFTFRPLFIFIITVAVKIQTFLLRRSPQ